MDEFAKGVYYAAGLLVRLFDEPSKAAEVLREAGLDKADISDLDDFEIESLCKLNSEPGMRLFHNN